MKRPKLVARRSPNKKTNTTVDKFNKLAKKAAADRRAKRRQSTKPEDKRIEAVRTAARLYIKNGYSCYLYGLEPDPEGGKRVWPDGWAQFKTECPPLDLIDKYVEHYPNLSLICTAFTNLTVIDCDNDVTVAAVEAILKPHIDIATIPQAVGNKGRHFYFQHVSELRYGVNKDMDRGLELDLTHSINAPPSLHRKTRKPYKWLTADILTLPPPVMPVALIEWVATLIETCRPSTAKATGQIFETDKRRYWSKAAGGQRHDVLINSLRIDFIDGGQYDDILERALAWAAGLDPPESRDEIIRQVNDVAQWAEQQQTLQRTMMQELNERWVHVPYGHLSNVYRIKKHSDTAQNCYMPYGVEPFKQIMFDVCPWQPKTTVGKWWLTHVDHNMAIEGTIFEPALESGYIEYDEEYAINLWPGLTVEPIQDDALFELFQEWYVKAVLCSNDNKYANWLMNWLAYMVQYPGRPGESALVLIGPQATGKTTLPQIIENLFGVAAFRFSHTGQLTGRFQDHLRHICCAHFDDAPFRMFTTEQAALLRYMITGLVMTTEAKYEKIQMNLPNYLHLIFTSNYPFSVPVAATGFERRFFVIEPDIDYQGDNPEHEYYERNTKLWAEFYNCIVNSKNGLSAVLYGLLNRNIDKWRPSPALATEWLYSEKRAAAGHFKIYFDEFINEIKAGFDYSSLIAKSMGADTYDDGIAFNRDALFAHYRKWSKENDDLFTKEDPAIKSKEYFGRKLKEYGVLENEPKSRMPGGGRTWYLRRDYVDAARRNSFGKGGP